MSRKQERSSETSKKVFPTRLRELMERPPKTSQPQLADAIGVQRQTISNYANGQSSPDWEALLKIADYFDVSADWLLGRKGAVERIDPKARAASEYTGLSVEAIDTLRSIQKEDVYDVMSEFLKQKGRDFAYQLFILRGNSEIVRKSLTNMDSASDSVKAFSESFGQVKVLELSMYEFERFCRKLPDMYGTNALLDEANKLASHFYDSSIALSFARDQSSVAWKAYERSKDNE